MKKILLALLAGSMLYVTGCKKSDDSSSSSYTCAACTSTPDAKAAYDNSSKGVYKGTVVGSTGTIKFDIGNHDSTITATMIIDGTTVTLTASVSWTSGVSYVSDFTGTMGGSPVTIHFSVGADGSNPIVTSADIPGHPGAVLAIAKETSTNLLKCFEGTYKSDDGSSTGTLNLFLSTSLKKWHATSKSSSGGGGNPVDGDFDGTSKLTATSSGGGVIEGTLSGDIINGTFLVGTGAGDKGTWTCKRTL